MDNTYNRLIETGIALFGKQSFDAVSVRDIVKHSKVNLSAISYHFGGKQEFYKAVVNYLVIELKDTFAQLDTDSFIQMSLPAMEIRLRETIITFRQLFLSINGQSRLNVFIREMASTDKNGVHQYLYEMLDTVRDHFYTVLGAYYNKRNEPTHKISFTINLLISVLKNTPQSPTLIERYNLDIEENFEQLINLILYSKF